MTVYGSPQERAEYLRAATTLEEDTKRREEDGQDDLDDVAASERHDGRVRVCGRIREGWS